MAFQLNILKAFSDELLTPVTNMLKEALNNKTLNNIVAKTGKGLSTMYLLQSPQSFELRLQNCIKIICINIERHYPPNY